MTTPKTVSEACAAFLAQKARIAPLTSEQADFVDGVIASARGITVEELRFRDDLDNGRIPKSQLTNEERAKAREARIDAAVVASGIDPIYTLAIAENTELLRHSPFHQEELDRFGSRVRQAYREQNR